MELEQFIKENWDGTVRLERTGNENLIGLPYEYYVPSITGMFQEMYYWDSFFTSKGLYIHGREALVKSHVDNMLYLVDKLGYMPNGSHRALITRSQPPFLFAMVRDLYDIYKDKVWLLAAYNVLCREYSFWMTKRSTPCGLNRYGYEGSPENIPADAAMIRNARLPLYDFGNRSDEDVVKNVMCDAESGWDFNPRCDMHQLDYTYVDLNSLLYMMEASMHFFATELGLEEAEKWQSAAEKRKKLMHSLMFNGEVYLDYNFKTNSHSKVFSAASYFPMWAKVATPEQAEKLVANLHRIEFDWGVATAEPGDRHGVTYQWDYPNGWAPLHYVVVYALDNYGFTREARRIAKKYTRSIEKIYKETGALWEKYNVTDGSIKVNDEYEMPQMLGWTSGVYLDLKKYLGEL